MSIIKLRYRGRVYRLARTREDDSWERVAELSKQLYTLSTDANIPTHMKRERARDKVTALLERFKLLGLDSPAL
jgi:hypothetical protein